MKDLLLFNLTLLVLSLLAVLPFLLLFAVVFGIGWLASGKSGEVPKIVMWALMCLGYGGHGYLFGLWSAICATMALASTAQPEVTWRWAYYVSGFLWSLVLVQSMHLQESKGVSSHAEVGRLARITTAYLLIAGAAYVAFAVRPDLMPRAYGSLLRLLRLA